MRRLTPHEFIQRARVLHGNRYDYSAITYVYSAETLPIRCKLHGIYLQRPSSHLAGNGCPECAGRRRLTLKSFVDKAKQIHASKYSYDKVTYRNNRSKITITCPIHGDFTQQASNHLSGQGCPSCGGSKKYSTDTFVQKAVAIHGNRYTYAMVRYIGNHDKVIITCPVHGDYEQTPHSHLAGNGCPRCGGTIKRTQEEFISNAKAIHGDRYCYSKTIYLSNTTKVSIACPEHGDFFQVPSSHLRGMGCPECGRLKAAEKLRMTPEDFVAKAKLIHGARYRYDKVSYQDNSTKVTITCPIHGDFAQTPHNHLKGKGCPPCGGYSRLTQEEFILRARQIHCDKYLYTTTLFTTVHHMVTITCPFHGDFEQRADKHLRGHGCRRCRMSRGEREIEIYLKKNNISYEYQYSPEGLRAKQNLSYDFRITIGGSMGLIEYHGVQHYRPVTFGGGVSDHKGNVARDAMKERYADTNKIPLLVISHTDYNRVPALLAHFVDDIQKGVMGTGDHPSPVRN